MPNWELFTICLFLAFLFEFVNGFHDTANAVATVIYTRSLKPAIAVLLSGFFNFLGVLTAGSGVAYGILNLLPPQVLSQTPIEASLAVVLAALMSSVIWNLFTWYLAIPASSSHTLIGSVLGVGVAYSCLPGHEFGVGVNWSKAIDIGASLLLSPLIGFVVCLFLYSILSCLITDPKIVSPIQDGKTPTPFVRLILIFTCIAVSFAHGSNDGQKGMGLIMLILVAFFPSAYVLNSNPQIPGWVVLGVALSLGIGTTVGWKRVVVTVGEKIGKSHLTPLQGAVAEVVSAAAIILSTNLKLPVSTTQVLSSGVAGTMVGAKKGVNSQVVKKILLAWLLTLPVSMGLSIVIFFVLRILFKL